MIISFDTLLVYGWQTDRHAAQLCNDVWQKTSIRASPHLQVMQLNTKCLLLKINPSLDLFYSVTLLVLLYLLEWQAHMQCQIPTFPIGSDG